MALEDYLLPGEKVVDSSRNIFLTEERVILYEESGLSDEFFQDINYGFLESVSLNEVSKPWLLVVSVLVGIIGLAYCYFTNDFQVFVFFMFVSFVFLLLFLTWKYRVAVFFGGNVKIESKNCKKEIIKSARRLQKKYKCS